MTDEPYRWLEAIANRREYIRDQLKGATPVFAFSRPEGILLAGVGVGQSKVFEIYDRHALAALGHPVDIEKIRQSLIEAAHLEGFTRAPEDVTVRRLLNFALGPALKNAFEQVLAAPIIVDGIFAEVGSDPATDILASFRYDGTYSLATGGVCVSYADPERAEAAGVWLKRQVSPASSLWEVILAVATASDVLTAEAAGRPAGFGAPVSPAPAPDPAFPPQPEASLTLAEGRVMEAALLQRLGPGRARYRALAAADWGNG